MHKTYMKRYSENKNEVDFDHWVIEGTSIDTKTKIFDISVISQYNDKLRYQIRNKSSKGK